MRDFATLAKRAGKDLAFTAAVSAAMSILHRGVLVPLLEKLTPRLKRVSPAAADLLRKAVGMAIGSPYERVKTLLQNAPAGTSAIEVATRAVAADGAAGCLRRIAQDVCLNLLRGQITGRLNVRLKPLLKGLAKKVAFLPKSVNDLLTGTVAGAVALAAVYPIDILRTRIFAGQDDGLLAAVQSCTGGPDGVLGLYRGYGISVATIVPVRASLVYGQKLFENPSVAVVALFKRCLHLAGLPAHYDDDDKKFGKYVGAQLAAFVPRLWNWPLDTIRRRLQLDDARKYRGALDCLVVTWRDEGVSALYGGFAWFVLVTPATWFAIGKLQGLVRKQP